MICLKSDRLEVHVLEPGEGANKTLRFNRAGFVSEVILDGKTYYCASEPNCLWHACSGGRGFCSDYLMDVSSEAEIGEWFPKLGVGLLKKFEDDQYWIFKKYECKDVAPTFKSWTDENGRSFVQFKTVTPQCLGYGLEETRTVCVYDNCMKFDVEIKNIGVKTISAREYCHNFVSIGGMAIGPAYTLELPDVQVPSGLIPSYEGVDNIEGIEGGLRIMGHSEKEYAIISLGEDKITSKDGFRWKLANSSDKAFVACEESFIPNEVKVWCVDHMVSPEVFKSIELEPGQTDFWSRTYTFGRLD